MLGFKPIEFVPAGTTFRFVHHWRLALVETILLALATAYLLVSPWGPGLNYGVDFRGGTKLELRVKDGPADIASIRTKLGELNVGGLQIQQFGDRPSDVLIRMEEQPGDEKAQHEAIARVQKAVGDNVELLSREVIGPAVSAELVTSAILALSLASLGIFLYVWFRFEWQFSVSAIIALLHDVAMTVCLFSILGLEFDLSIVAALLTLIGYAVNDTVVTFDRVRENLRKYKRMPLGDLIDHDAAIHDHRDAPWAPSLLVFVRRVERESEQRDVYARRLARAGRKIEHARPCLVGNDLLEQALLPREGLLAAVDSGVERAELRARERHRSSTGRHSPKPK